MAGEITGIKVTGESTVRKIDYEALANKPTIPSKTSQLQNDSGFIMAESIDNVSIKRNGNGELYALVESALLDESDPTVPSWAKQPNKPSYTSQEVGAIPTTSRGVADGVAELDSTGRVPSSQLPSYVDDVTEYPSLDDFPEDGETGKIYVSTLDNTTYRWSGSTYVKVGSSLALGETSSTAFRGDHGKVAYSHAVARGYNSCSQGLWKFAMNDHGHVTSVSAVKKSDISALGIPSRMPDKMSELANDAGFAVVRDVPIPDGMTIGEVDGMLSLVRSTTLELSEDDYTYILYKADSDEMIVHVGQSFSTQNDSEISFDDDLTGMCAGDVEIFVFPNGAVYYSVGNTVRDGGLAFSYPKRLRYIGHVSAPDDLGEASLVWYYGENSSTLVQLVEYRVKATYQVGLPDAPGIPIATSESVGAMRPDGVTTLVSDDGTLSVAKRVSRVVSSGPSASKGDFTYVVAKCGEYSTLYDVRTIDLVCRIDSSPFLVRIEYYKNSFQNMYKSAIVVNVDGSIYLTTNASMSGSWFETSSDLELIGESTRIAQADDDSVIAIDDIYIIGLDYTRTQKTVHYTNLSFVSDTYASGIPVDNMTIVIDDHGRIAADPIVESPIESWKNALGSRVIRLRYGYGLSVNDERRLSVSLPYVFERISESSSGIITYDDETKTLGIRNATSSKAGVVRPDNETTFMSGEKLTAKSYDAEIDGLRNNIRALMRRVAALESELGHDTMTYEDGTLYVNSTYEDGTLMTNRTYDNDTLL